MCASFGIRVVAGCMPKNGIAGSYGSSIILFIGCAEFLKDSVVVAHGLSCSVACGIFLDQGSNPVSPALAGRFFTTRPPGKLSEVKFEYCVQTLYW